MTSRMMKADILSRIRRLKARVLFYVQKMLNPAVI